MDFSGLFTGNLGLILFRQAYIYALPGSVALYSLTVLAQAFEKENVFSGLLAPLPSEGILFIVVIAVAAYLFGIVIDALMRYYFRAGFAHGSSAQEHFRIQVEKSLEPLDARLAQILRESMSPDRLDAIRDGRDLSHKEFSKIFNDAMLAIDTECKLRDYDAFRDLTTPAQLGTLFAGNLSLSIQFLAIAIAASLPLTCFTQVCGSSDSSLLLSVFLLLILALAIATNLPFQLIGQLMGTDSRSLILSAYLHLIVAASVFLGGLLLRKRAAGQWSLLIDQSFHFARTVHLDEATGGAS
jgi:hypothetical protein